MNAQEKIELFKSIFKSRTDVYAKRWEKNNKHGYSPAYKFDWNEFNLHKAKGGTIKNFSNKECLPLTDDIIKKHLLGEETVGIYPLLNDNSSYFIAADFDKKSWQDDCIKFISSCNEYEINAYLECSRSGNGGHVWIFFEENYPAYKSRKIFLEIIRKTFNLSVFDKEISFDRLFPNQDYLSGEGLGNLIALPLNGKNLVKYGKSVFLNPGNFEPYIDQWDFLSKINKLNIQKLDEIFFNFSSNKNIKSFDFQFEELTIIVKNMIFLDKKYLTSEIINFLKENLNYLNSEYLIKKKIGKSTYKLNKYFKTILEKDNYVLIPKGFLNQIKDFLKANGLNYKILDQRKKFDEIDFESKINLYFYQEEIINKVLSYENGIIVAPPGSGKSIVSLEIVARLRQPTLIITHRKQIYTQWIERIQSFLGIPKKQIGRIGSNIRKIENKINVAMIQTLTKINSDDEIFNKFGLIIVDECHHVPAKMFHSVINQFNSYYIYGLTATPKRKHNDERLIFVYLGDIIARLEKNDLMDNNCNKEIFIHRTEFEIPFDSKVDDYQLLSKMLIFDSKRNKQIINEIIKESDKNKKILVITERKEHIEVLKLFLKDKIELITITGDDSVKEQAMKIKEINNLNYQVILSTGQFFGEGTDISSLNCLFLVFPFSFEGKLIQYIGRVERNHDNITIHDYRDINIKYLEDFYKSRKKHYKKCLNSGFKVYEE